MFYFCDWRDKGFVVDCDWSDKGFVVDKTFSGSSEKQVTGSHNGGVATVVSVPQLIVISLSNYNL